MGTLTAGFFAVRWELLSALLMFVSSVLNIRSKQAGYGIIAFLFSLLGLLMACWFVLNATGATIDSASMANFFIELKDDIPETLSSPEMQRWMYTSML
ncbi:hypothetical protein FJU30_05355 [Affinibrenneria salicis]|uniref:Uncharacterized protein n=1 Tax=Affinibrenneria salicis TaxID=2590031 RepID=A0A5J5G468_9GAMM|nr:YjcB family protein [Affinibrenneria salicis]KAA9001722.1 hypothetical protein FJU30_05355 [Affinibrenneria salicis]